MNTCIRTALLSAFVLSLTCGLATASERSAGTHTANTATAHVASRAHGGVLQSLTVKCKDPIECSKGRA